jgi:hypothetical protein
VGVTANQPEGPDVMAAAAVKPSAELPVMLMGCAAGAVPPVWNLKVSEVGLTVMVGELETVMVTGTDIGLFEAPLAVIMMVPLKVPAAVNTDVLMDTLMGAGVVPEVGFTDNHPVGPEVMAAAAVKDNPEVPPMLTVWDGGLVLPI